MPTTKIILFEHKAKKNNEAPLYLRLIKDRKPKYVSLKLYVLPKYWDADKEKVKPSHPNSLRINNYLVERTRAALDSLIDIETEDPSAPAIVLKQSVMGVAQEDFFTFSYRYIKVYESKGKISTFRRYKAVLSKLKAYLGNKDFQFHHLTIKFLKDYEYYLRTTLNNDTNTVVGNFKAIRHIVNEAISENIIQPKRNPFFNYKLQWIQTERVFLTEEEIEAIENLNLPANSKRYHHRNMYIFACHAGGIRISDLIQLKWENFSGDHILLNTQKTGAVISIKLPKKALEIIDLYYSKNLKKDDFIFPFLDKSDDLSNPKVLNTRISSITAYTNSDLNDIAKMAGIEKHIHFHTSRHTWATRALRKGMRIEYVSKLMGHNSIRTTQIYAKIVNADLDKAMEVFDE
jgi:integrase/recombinase XerD